MRLTAAIVFAAVFLGGAGVIITDKPGQPELRPAEAESMLFANPTMDGKRIDIRFAGHMMADPKFTAEQYCRNQGYTKLAYYVIRPSGATRTMGDGEIHVGGSDALSSFRLIACGHLGAKVAAKQYVIGQ